MQIVRSSWVQTTCFILAQGRLRYLWCLRRTIRASLVAQTIMTQHAMQETWVWSLGWEHPLDKGMATHSSVLAWRIPWTEEPGGLQSTGSQRVRHDREALTPRLGNHQVHLHSRRIFPERSLWAKQCVRGSVCVAHWIGQTDVKLTAISTASKTMTQRRYERTFCYFSSPQQFNKDLLSTFLRAFGLPLVAQLVKNLPAMQGTWVRSLDWDDPLEKGKVTHSIILAWRIPWTVQSMVSQRVRHDWATFTFAFFLWRLYLCHFIQFSPHAYEASTSMPSILQTSCSSADWWQHWRADSDPGRWAPDGSGCYTVNGWPHISETDSGESKQDNAGASGTANCRL